MVETRRGQVVTIKPQGPMGQQRALGARESPSLAWGPLNLPGGGDASIGLETHISLPGIPATPLSSGSLPTPPPHHIPEKSCR